MKCTHGVELILDKGLKCFECETVARVQGLPEGSRQVDVQEYVRNMWKDNTPEETAKRETGLRRLWDDMRADARNEGFTRDINGDKFPHSSCPHEAEAAQLRGELKALQRNILAMRQEAATLAYERDEARRHAGIWQAIAEAREAIVEQLKSLMKV